MVRKVMVAALVALALPGGWPLLVRVLVGVAGAVALSALEWAVVPSGPAALDWWKQQQTRRGDAAETGRSVESRAAGNR
jgi:antibiotic biosynthesis monooxygenase (ABM) superfamily enzyme